MPNIANFETFNWNISLRANLLFLKGFPATLTCTNIGGFSKSNISVRMFIWKVLSITIFLSLGFSVYRIHHYDVLSHYKLLGFIMSFEAAIIHIYICCYFLFSYIHLLWYSNELFCDFCWVFIISDDQWNKTYFLLYFISIIY